MKKPTTRELRIPEKTKVEETLALAELGKKAQMVFHDLSNHLTVLTMSISDLEENLERDRERLKEYSQKSESARVQMEYVANLLRTHLRDSCNELFSPATEIEKIVCGFATKAGLSKVRIIPRTDKNLRINGRKNDFIHIISNLISNALDSFEEVDKINNAQTRERRVEVCLSRSTSGSLIQVSDTGCGIAEQNLNKIFVRGFSTKQQGHGLGLFATKEYVERSFGGTISVKSSSEGTTFLVTIPSPNPSSNPNDKNQINSSTKQNRKRSPFPVLLSQALSENTDPKSY